MVPSSAEAWGVDPLGDFARLSEPARAPLPLLKPPALVRAEAQQLPAVAVAGVSPVVSGVAVEVPSLEIGIGGERWAFTERDGEAVIELRGLPNDLLTVDGLPVPIEGRSRLLIWPAGAIVEGDLAISDALVVVHGDLLVLPGGNLTLRNSTLVFVGFRVLFGVWPGASLDVVDSLVTTPREWLPAYSPVPWVNGGAVEPEGAGGYWWTGLTSSTDHQYLFRAYLGASRVAIERSRFSFAEWPPEVRAGKDMTGLAMNLGGGLLIGAETIRIVGSEFRYQGGVALWGEGSPPVVSGNRFHHMNYGLVLGRPAFVVENVFDHLLTGIAERSSGSVIARNLIEDTRSAALASGSVYLENRFDRAYVFFQFDPPLGAPGYAPVLRGNSLGAREAAALLAPGRIEWWGGDVVDARENWWGHSEPLRVSRSLALGACVGMDVCGNVESVLTEPRLFAPPSGAPAPLSPIVSLTSRVSNSYVAGSSASLTGRVWALDGDVSQVDLVVDGVVEASTRPDGEGPFAFALRTDRPTGVYVARVVATTAQGAAGGSAVRFAVWDAGDVPSTSLDPVTGFGFEREESWPVETRDLVERFAPSGQLGDVRVVASTERVVHGDLDGRPVLFVLRIEGAHAAGGWRHDLVLSRLEPGLASAVDLWREPFVDAELPIGLATADLAEGPGEEVVLLAGGALRVIDALGSLVWAGPDDRAFGFCLADVTGDGRADVISPVHPEAYLDASGVGSAGFDAFWFARDGATGERLWRTPPRARGLDGTFACTPAGDADGDGVGDVLVLGYLGSASGVGNAAGAIAGGQVALLSGREGRALWWRAESGILLGAAVADFDGDGVADVALAAPQSVGICLLWECAAPLPAGDVVRVVDGRSGRVLWVALTLGAVTGIAVGDVDGDGAVEVVASGAAVRAGRWERPATLIAYRGATGEPLWGAGGVLLPGVSVVSRLWVADLDGLGGQDVVVFAPSEIDGSGKLIAIEGAGRVMWEALSAFPIVHAAGGRLAPGGGLALSVANGFDFVGVLDGPTGRVLSGAALNAPAGASAVSQGGVVVDLDEDGQDEFLVAGTVVVSLGVLEHLRFGTVGGVYALGVK